MEQPVRMPAVWTPRHAGHAPGGGYWLGVEVSGDEEPPRGEVLRAALEGAGADVHLATLHGDEPVLRVHDPEYLDWFARAWPEWEAAGLVEQAGQRRVVPYVFALPQLTSGRPMSEPAAVWARSGRFAMDTMTLIAPGTYDAARGAVDVALTACDLVMDGEQRAAYAACRPPGHHAGAALYGGSCYLNNAAVAAQYLRDGGAARVAVIDIDAHHGNGTQELFYARDDVFFGSVHVDPAQGWFPHFLGFASERGAGDGMGFTTFIGGHP
ncbi:MAG: histone deacetylase family protein, partial [Acidimicrobiia bacterium]